MDKYIGFDIGDKETIACIVQNNQKDIYQTLPTDPAAMKAWLTEQRGPNDKLHLTFEVCGMAGWLYDNLVDDVDTLQVSNPHAMTWIYRTRKKSDRVDARKQAKLRQIDEIPRVHMPPADVRQWRQQIQHRRRLIQSRVQWKNRIRTLVKGQGHRQAAHKGSWWSKKNRQWLESLAASEAACWTESLLDLLEQLTLCDQQIQRATARLDQRLQQHTGAALLQTIPGVGPRTCEAVLAYTDEVERFARGKDYCSYFGMTPKLDQSGQIRREGHISKQGPSVVRWLLVEGAWRAVKKSPAFAAFYERVRRHSVKRKKIAVVAAARKMLSVMRAMLITGEVYNENLVLRQEQVKRKEAAQRQRRRAFYH